MTFECRGSLRRDAWKRPIFEFRSVDVKGTRHAGVAFSHVPFTARIEGPTMRDNWRYPDETRRVDLHGEFVLALDGATSPTHEYPGD